MQAQAGTRRDRQQQGLEMLVLIELVGAVTVLLALIDMLNEDTRNAGLRVNG